MKSLFLVALLAGAAAGAGAALVAGSLMRPVAEPIAHAVSPDDDLDVTRALQLIEEENRELAERIGALETQIALVRPEREPATSAPASDVVAVDEELKELVAALRDPGAVPPANFQESVSRALQNIRDQEDRERDERRRQVYEERLDERLSELALELGLTKNQTDGLRSLYLEQNERREQLMEAARVVGDWGSMRDSFREMRDQMDQRLSQLLTPDQLERYNEAVGGGRGWGAPGGFMPFDGDDRGRSGRDRGDEEGRRERRAEGGG